MGSKSLRDCFAESFLNQEKKKAVTFLRAGEIETEISYLQLHRDSNQMARTFQDLGVEKTDRVILCIQKAPIFVTAHLALQKVGATCVPLKPGLNQ